MWSSIVGFISKHLTMWIDKSKVFNWPMYRMTLEDGRSVKVCEEHLNSVVIKQNPNNNAIYVDKVLDTNELVKLPLQHVRSRKTKAGNSYTSHEDLIFIRNCFI